MLSYGLFVCLEAPVCSVNYGGSSTWRTFHGPRKCEGSVRALSPRSISAIDSCSDWNWPDIDCLKVRRVRRWEVCCYRRVWFWTADAWVTTEFGDTSVIYEATSILAVSGTVNSVPKPRGR